MKKQTFNRQPLLIFALVFLLCGAAPVAAQTTEFNYQGRINENNAPAVGSFDLEFRLFTAATGGAPLAAVQRPNVAVVNGVFSVTLDFGDNLFNGAARYLETAVRPAGTAGAFTIITPRLKFTATPYALRSLVATNAERLGSVPANLFVQTSDARLSNARTPAGAADGDLTGSYPNPTIAPNAVTASKIADGNVVKSLNGLRDAVQIAGGSGITVTTNANGVTLSTASPLLRKYAFAFNTDRPLNVTLAHNLGTTDVQVVLYKLVNNVWEQVPYGNSTFITRALDVNRVQVAIFSSGELRIVIIG